MSGIGDGRTEWTRKRSKKKSLEKTTEPMNPKTPQQEYDDDFDHMLASHEEHHESLAGRLNSLFPNSFLARHFALRVLHWQAHGMFKEDDLTVK